MVLYANLGKAAIFKRSWFCGFDSHGDYLWQKNY